MENWVNLNERYCVSDMGRFWSAYSGVLKTPPMNTGYPHCNIRENGKSKRIMCHVAVAKAFIPNPENKPQVNHKNGIRHDNSVENLEWATCAENMIHAIQVLGKKAAKNNHRRKTIRAFKENGESAVIKGIREMARYLEIPYQAVQAGIRNPKLTYKGWKFKLMDDPYWISKSGRRY